MTGHPSELRERSFSFGPFLLVPERQALMRDETPVRIGGRALDILTALVERPGEVVAKRELMARAWPNLAVEEGNLKVNMATLRRALGEGRGPAKYIATVVGRGYRFVAPVHLSGPPPPSIDAGAAPKRRHNLPAATTRIVGRAEAIEGILRDLGEARIVSVVGPGGIGKTTVALAVAEQAVGQSRDGVWLVDLSSLSDPSLVPNAIATAIGLVAQSADILAALSEFLRDREMLLLLDNCEQIIDGVASCVDHILAAAANVKVLATSREPLRLKGERVRRLPGLGTPSASSAPSAEEALAFPAVQLFVDRATDRVESFNLSNVDAPIAAEICRRLDGLALAIELAATRVDAFGVGGLLDQLDNRFRLLEGWRAGPERHRTLMATIDWSYELLPDAERQLLRQVSIFAGGFTLEAAAAIAAQGDASVVAQGISNLVSKSLITLDSAAPTGRWRLLDTIRAYALQRLAAGNELQITARRHAEYLRDFVLRSSGSSPDQQPATAELVMYSREIGNVRAALDWSFSPTGDAGIGIELTSAFVPVWVFNGLLDEVYERADRALHGLTFDPKLDLLLTNRLYLGLGLALLHTTRSAKLARAALTNALEGARKLDDVKTQFIALWVLWILYANSGQVREALLTASEYKRTAQRMNDPGVFLVAERLIGVAEHFGGRHLEAQRHFEHLLNHYVAPRDQSHTAWLRYDQLILTKAMRARVMAFQGYLDQAVALMTDSLDAVIANKNSSILEVLRLAAFPILMMTGNTAAAEQAVRDLSRSAITFDGPFWLKAARCMQASLQIERGELDQGITSLRAVLDDLGQSGWAVNYPEYLGILAKGVSQEGRPDDAVIIVDEGLETAKKSGEEYYVPELLRIKGQILAKRSTGADFAAAAQCFAEGLSVARDQGALLFELRNAMSIAELEYMQGRAEAARQVLAPVYARFTEGFGYPDLQSARALLDACNSGA